MSSPDQSNLKSMVYISSLTKTDNKTGAIKTYRERTVSTNDGLCVLSQGVTVLIVDDRSWVDLMNTHREIATSTKMIMFENECSSLIMIRRFESVRGDSNCLRFDVNSIQRHILYKEAGSEPYKTLYAV